MTTYNSRPRPSAKFTEAYFQSLNKASRSGLINTMPHRHQQDGELCTSRECLREASHKDHHCRVVPSLAEVTCYDPQGNFSCRSRAEGRSHCPRQHNLQQGTNKRENPSIRPQNKTPGQDT